MLWEAGNKGRDISFSLQKFRAELLESEPRSVFSRKLLYRKKYRFTSFVSLRKAITRPMKGIGFHSFTKDLIR
jgi:hypothetical protein